MDPIVVIGGGGHAKVVLSILRKLGKYQIVGYTDLRDNGVLLGADYLGSDQELTSMAAGQSRLNAVLAIGQVGLGMARQGVQSRLHSLSLSFPSIVSPNAVVNEEVRFGAGVTVMDGVVINSGASIGRGAIVNTNSTVEHDVRIDDWVHIAPGVTISGGVTIGRFSMIGAGATVIGGKQIASECIVGAGATVVHNLTEPGVYVGSPARRIR
jgi:sugar O-acyltransferase (sialic acid O-acetyltransferase NeuD family)